MKLKTFFKQIELGWWPHVQDDYNATVNRSKNSVDSHWAEKKDKTLSPSKITKKKKNGFSLNVHIERTAKCSVYCVII